MRSRATRHWRRSGLAAASINCSIGASANAHLINTDHSGRIWLGDVSDGFIPGQGDNLVAIADISLLGANYGITLVHTKLRLFHH